MAQEKERRVEGRGDDVGTRGTTRGRETRVRVSSGNVNGKTEGRFGTGFTSVNGSGGSVETNDKGRVTPVYTF